MTNETIIEELGEAGLRMAQLGATEGTAGNLSVFVREAINLPNFTSRGTVDLPVAAPALVDGWVIVTGSGRRLRDIARRPQTTLCVFQIHPDGQHATFYAADTIRPTSEFNTHLAVHNDHVARHGHATHAVLHAQSIHLSYLSHIARYADTRAFNRALLRWQPESIIEFPEGIGTLPFQAPGSDEQMRVTTDGLRTYRAVLWQRHGIVTRATDIGKAADLIEYAETAAHYEYLNLVAGEPSAGMSDHEIRLICERLGIVQPFF